MTLNKNKRSKITKFISWLDIQLLFVRNKFKYRIADKLSASWIVAPVFLILTVFIFVSHRTWLGNPPIPNSSAELFFGIGTVTGAMLAIVFAFSSQLVSRASEALPARYFRLFARDTRIDLCYITLGVITVLEFALGVMSINEAGNVNTFLVRFGIWLMLATVVILYYSYVRLIKLMSHEYQVEWLSKYHKKQVDEISYIAKRMSRASQRGYHSLSEEEKLIIEGNMYEPLQNQIKGLNDNLDGIIELYFTYKSKGDDYAAHNYIHVASGMIMAYLLSRQRNTLLTTSPEAGLTPESNLSAFLQTSFEKLKVIWDKALLENDVYAIRKYLRDVQGIVRVSLMVEHVKYPDTNPAFLTAYYNFSQLIKDSIKAKNVDALFEIASVLEQITEVAITKKHRVDALDAILKDMQSMCTATIASTEDMSAVTHNVVKNMLTVCNRILTQDAIDDNRLRRMQEVVPSCITITTLGRSNSLTDIAVTHFGDNIFAMATHGMNEPPTKKQVQKIIQTSRFTISILLKLASVANGTRYQTQSMNRAIFIMTSTLTKILGEGFATESQVNDIRRVMSDLANLPSSFPSPKNTKSMNDVDDFIDRLTQAAIVCIRSNQPDLANDIFNSISEYLINMLTDNSGKFEVGEILRIVNNTKLIGAAAKKAGKIKLQKHVAEKIRKFEAEYHKKYYPQYPKGYDTKTLYIPSPSMLRQEYDNDIFGYHGSGLPAYFQDSRAFFLEEYAQADIEKFETFIWQ